LNMRATGTSTGAPTGAETGAFRDSTNLDNEARSKSELLRQ
jgi:hypothetical protein